MPKKKPWIKVCDWCKTECAESNFECPKCEGPLHYPDWVYEARKETKTAAEKKKPIKK